MIRRGHVTLPFLLDEKSHPGGNGMALIENEGRERNDIRIRRRFRISIRRQKKRGSGCHGKKEVFHSGDFTTASFVVLASSWIFRTSSAVGGLRSSLMVSFRKARRLLSSCVNNGVCLIRGFNVLIRSMK